MKSRQATKSYELTFEVRDGYAYAYIAGEHDNLEVCSAYWGEIGQKLTDHGITKVLIVEDIAEESPLADVYHLVCGLADMGFSGVKVAFVDRYSDHQALNDFGVLVATNRGLIGKAFSNESEGEKW